MSDANSVREGKIPDGYDNAVVDEKTGKVETKTPMTGGPESWPDANRRSE
jgi:hypothetical protein